MNERHCSTGAVILQGIEMDNFVFGGGEIGCSIPLGATNFDTDTAFKVFQRFPGFDYPALTLAMQSVADDRFLVWRRHVED